VSKLLAKECIDANSMMIFSLLGYVCTRVPDLQLRAGVIVGVDQSCPPFSDRITFLTNAIICERKLSSEC
jgi:hypothetical protein